MVCASVSGVCLCLLLAWTAAATALNYLCCCCGCWSCVQFSRGNAERERGVRSLQWCCGKRVELGCSHCCRCGCPPASLAGSSLTKIRSTCTGCGWVSSSSSAKRVRETSRLETHYPVLICACPGLSSSPLSLPLPLLPLPLRLRCILCELDARSALHWRYCEAHSFGSVAIPLAPLLTDSILLHHRHSPLPPPLSFAAQFAIVARRRQPCRHTDEVCSV